jgi:[ribosomal protein S5]-alanine N-acetyltransferase
MKPDTPLSTDRLDLEPLVVAHARELWDEIRDPALYAFIEEAPPPSLAALEARYRVLERRAPPDGRPEVWLNWACRERASGQIAGLLQATLAPGVPALIAYVFTARGQGRGLAREACRAVVRSLLIDWAQPAVEATVDPGNARSIALLEALGFVRVPSATADLRYRCDASS